MLLGELILDIGKTRTLVQGRKYAADVAMIEAVRKFSGKKPALETKKAAQNNILVASNGSRCEIESHEECHRKNWAQHIAALFPDVENAVTADDEIVPAALVSMQVKLEMVNFRLGELQTIFDMIPDSGPDVAEYRWRRERDVHRIKTVKRKLEEGLEDEYAALAAFRRRIKSQVDNMTIEKPLQRESSAAQKIFDELDNDEHVLQTIKQIISERLNQDYLDDDEQKKRADLLDFIRKARLMDRKTDAEKLIDTLKETEQEKKLSSFVSEYLKNFKPIKIIGEGSCGIVFDAQFRLIGMNYAVKRIPLKGSDTKIQTALKEVKSLASLVHQGIVRYHHSWLEQPPPDWQRASDASIFKDLDLNEHEAKFPPYENHCTFLYIQTELCKSTLALWLVENERRSSIRIREWFKQIVSAVAYIHEQKTIHRDLKVTFSHRNSQQYRIPTKDS